MESCLFKLILTWITFSLLSIVGDSRDLRPSEHGLAHQTSPATSDANSSAAMTSFFRQPNSTLPSPTARNSTGSPPTPTEDWWPPSKGENKRLEALKVAAIACGGAGVVLLVAAGLLFVCHFHKRKSGDASPSRDRNAGTSAQQSNSLHSK